MTGIANFGGSVAAVSDIGFGFTQNVMQVNNSTTMLRGNHALKAGLDLQWVADTRANGAAQLYTFPNTAAYLAAKDGSNRLGYTTFTQYFGLPDLEYNTAQYGFFVQDDWRVSSGLQAALRRALRPLRRARCRPERPDRDVARVPDLGQQLRAPRRRGVVARLRQEDGAARQHRHHV